MEGDKKLSLVEIRTEEQCEQLVQRGVVSGNGIF